MKKPDPHKSRPIYVGIDPGKSDGVIVYAWAELTMNSDLSMESDYHVNYEHLDGKDAKTLYRQLFRIANMTKARKYAVMEKAGMHRAKNSASSSAAGARHNGQLEMALVALGFTYTIVQPRKWMDTLGKGRPTDRPIRKTWIHNMMMDRHPDFKIHKYAGDAVAIFDYMLAEKGVKIEY